MVLIDKHEYLTEEEKRLKEDRERTRYWKRWGPYVAERQWATGGFNIFPQRERHTNDGIVTGQFARITRKSDYSDGLLLC